MNKNLTYILYPLLCLCLVMQGCSTDSDVPAGFSDSSMLAIQVNQTLFVTPDGNPPVDSRAADTGSYGTVFTTDDAIGVFVLLKDGTTLKVNNQQVTLQPDGTWLPALPYVSGATYYAYYPYRSDMSGKKFIDDIATALREITPATDQSNLTLYTAQYAMTAPGAPNTADQTVTFSFAHLRALIEINLPAGSADITFHDIKPYQYSGTTYRYLASPNSQVELSCNYTNSGSEYISTATITTPASGGQYKKVNIKLPK